MREDGRWVRKKHSVGYAYGGEGADFTRLTVLSLLEAIEWLVGGKKQHGND